MRSELFALLILFAGSTSPLAAADGEPDLDFGGDGLVSWAYTSGTIPPIIGGVAVTALATSEDLVVAVGWHGEAHLNFRSYDRSGVVGGPRCSQHSETLFVAATDSKGKASLVDSTGNLLVGGEVSFLGSETQSRPLVARFDLGASGCDLDDSFSANGWAVYDDESFCDTEDCAVVALGELRPVHGVVAAPRVVALVRSVVVEEVISRFYLLGLTSSGAIDTGFGSQGWRSVAPTGLGALAPEVAFEIDARGRINLALTRYDPDGNFDQDVVLLRYSSGGTLDTAIGTAGLVTISDGGPDDGVASIARSLSFDARGRAAVGYYRNGSSSFVVLDLGTGATDFRSHLGFLAPLVEAQGDGRLVTLHDRASQDGFRAWRWLVPESPSLAVDPTFGGGSWDYDVDLGDDDIETLVDMTLWHGRPVYLGNATMELAGVPFGHIVNGAFLIRVDNDYVFADGFETGGWGRWTHSAP